MEPAQHESADRIFREALQHRGARDPREYYRDQLRQLKRSNPQAYRSAVSHYEEELIPAIASGAVEPLGAWLAYGCLIANLVVEGRAIEVDPSGRQHPYEPPVPRENMVLHLPDASGARALAVGLPPSLSPAQQAAFDLLVQGRQRLRDQETEG
jgi:hypothetical protein